MPKLWGVGHGLIETAVGVAINSIALEVLIGCRRWLASGLLEILKCLPARISTTEEPTSCLGSIRNNERCSRMPVCPSNTRLRLRLS